MSVLQWLLTSSTSHPANTPPVRLSRFFTSLYAALRNPSRAVFQFYPETDDQVALITSLARKAGFGGGVVVDYPNSKKARKVFLCLMVGSGKYAPNGSSMGDGIDVNDQGLPRGLDGEEGSSEPKSVLFERRREREKVRDKKGKKKVVDKTWILKKKEVYRGFSQSLKISPYSVALPTEGKRGRPE